MFLRIANFGGLHLNAFAPMVVLLLVDVGGRFPRCFRATPIDVVGFGQVSERVIYITPHFSGSLSHMPIA